MNWIKSLWSKLVAQTPDDCCTPTLVEVEEETRSAGSIFATLCRAAGVKQRDLDGTDAEALFDEWYAGDITEENIKQSVAEFKTLYPTVNAKLEGKL